MNNLILNGKVLRLPSYFASISSIKSNECTLGYLKILDIYKDIPFLVSAFDIYYADEKSQLKIKEILEKQKELKRTVIIDSGNYESYWDKSKKWDISKFYEIIQNFYADIIFSYDNQYPTGNVDDDCKQIIITSLDHEKIEKNGFIVPIVHSKKESIAEVAKMVIEKLEPVLIAIPERILGDGIIERMTTLKNIYNETNGKCAIHLLGTGNPISIMLYSLCGASTFDGLEWCQTTVNHSDNRLYHFQQRELFKYQNESIESDNISYSLKTMWHNLLYYDELNKKLQNGYTLSKFQDEFGNDFSKESIDSICRIIGEE